MDIADTLTETITVKRQTAHTKFGDAVHGTTLTMAARIERGRVEFGDLGGRSAKDSTRVITVSEVKLGDVLWFPEEDATNADQGHRVQEAHAHRDLDGIVTHYTATL